MERMDARRLGPFQAAGRRWGVVGLVLAVLAASGCPPPGGAGAVGGPLGRAARLRLQGRQREAIRLYTSLVAEARQAKAWKRVVSPTIALAELQARVGRLTVARALLQNAIKEARKRKARNAAARLYLALGGVCFRYAHYQAALDQWLWARMFARAAKDQALQATVAARLGELAALRGDYDVAVGRMSEATLHCGALRGAALGPAALATGRAFARLADWPRARRYYQRALAAFDQAGPQLGGAEVVLARARLELASGDALAARRGFDQALQRLAALGAVRRRAQVAWAYAQILEQASQPLRAADLRAQARRLFGTLGDTYNQARLDRAAAAALAHRGHHRDALPLASRAARALEGLGDHLAAGRARLQVARALVQLGQAAEAVGELTRVLDHAAAAGAPELAFLAYAMLGSITETLLDRPAQAARFQRGAVHQLERVRAGLSLVGIDDPALEEDAYFRLARVFIKRWRRSGDPAHYDAALGATDRARARELVDLLSRTGASLADDAKGRQRVRALSGEERELVATLTRPGGAREWRRSLYRRLAQVRKARDRIERAALRFSAAQPAPATVAILKRALGPRDAMLVFQVGQRGSLLFAINDRVSRAVELPGRAALHKLVKRFRQALSRGSLADARRAGEAVRRRLLDPVAGVYRGRDRIHLCLSGPLRQVPFGALPASRGGWLGTRAAFVRVVSPAVWLKVRATPRGTQAALQLQVQVSSSGALRAGRSPIRDILTSRGHPLHPLAGALGRGRALVALFPKGQAALVLDPTERQLRKQGWSRARFVHLATALVLPSDIAGTVQPALLVAGSQGPSNDGLLLTREVLGMPVDTQLLSVEGLDVGRQAPAPRGRTAMARVLQLAGAQRVLLPLRPKPASGSAFLQQLYRRLAAGDAMSAAQIAASRAALKAAHGHPRGLMGYVLYGTLAAEDQPR